MCIMKPCLHVICCRQGRGVHFNAVAKGKRLTMPMMGLAFPMVAVVVVVQQLIIPYHEMRTQYLARLCQFCAQISSCGI